MSTGLSRVYPLIGLFSGYAIVLLFNPVRVPLRDGFRCVLRYKRVWLTFVLLGSAYFVFQFSTFTPIQSTADVDLTQITSMANWHWPTFMEIWREAPLPALEGVAGIFDNATTTYPLSAIAAVLMLINWRGLHGALVRALQKRFHFWGYLVYLIVLLSAVAALSKPIIYWALPLWGGLLPEQGVLQVSASVDAVAFIFEYLFGVYIQVYLIAVCFAGIHFFFLTTADAIMRGAIADRLVAMIIWKSIFVFLRGFITGWLLASWVCLFRRGETGHVYQQAWIEY